MCRTSSYFSQETNLVGINPITMLWVVISAHKRTIVATDHFPFASFDKGFDGMIECLVVTNNEEVL